MKINSVPVTRRNLGKYGQLVTRPSSRPTSQAVDYKFWSDLAHYFIHGETEIGLCTVFQQPHNIITGMERHLKTPEILIPIDAPFILPLLLENDQESRVRAFMVGLGQAVVIDAAVWHGASLPAEGKQCTYFVIFGRKTPFQDVEKKQLRPIEISW